MPDCVRARRYLDYEHLDCDMLFYGLRGRKVPPASRRPGPGRARLSECEGGRASACVRSLGACAPAKPGWIVRACVRACVRASVCVCVRVSG